MTRPSRSAAAPPLAALTSLLAACGGVPASGPEGGSGSSFVVNCQLPTPSAEALRPAGEHPLSGEVSRGWIQPGGRDLVPVGTLLPVGGYPLSLKPLPKPYERYVIISSGGHGPNYVMLVDTRPSDPSKAVVSKLGYGDSGSPNPRGLFFGLELGSVGGLHAFVSGGGAPVSDPANPGTSTHFIDVLAIASDPPTLRSDRRLLIPPGPRGNRFPTGLHLSSDEKQLYVAGQSDGSLSILNVDSAAGPSYGKLIGSTIGLGLFAYDVTVDERVQRAYVSVWGGAIPAHGPSGVRDGIVAIDLTDPSHPTPLTDPSLDLVLDTGKSSEQLLFHNGTVYVAAADADRVTALDSARLTMPVAQSLSGPSAGFLGASPNALAIDEAAARLYVANSHDNTVSVLALPGLMPLGRFPTAAFPTAVAVLSDGTVVVSCAKGLGSYPNDQLPQDGSFYQGIVQVVPRPSAQDLALWDRLATTANSRPQSYQVNPSCAATPRRFPLPPQAGDESPIKYVFLIIKENQSYDQILGDLPGARGSAALALFGGDNTPNQHELARRFVNLDNFYANADQSTQGHEWTSAAYSNDYVDKSSTQRNGHPDSDFGGSSANEHAAVGGAGSVFQAMERLKIPFQNYGEIVNSIALGGKFDKDYPGLFFNLDVPDVDRADYLVAKLHDPEVELERFHYILFPRDHTFGTTPGRPTPQSMVADNDEAVGRFIDGLSHSRYWSQSVVFVIEDDPQDGADHIDQHRSICLVISPWVRRGYVSSVHYDDPSLWHTIELLLGMPPLNSFDRSSAAMYDLFASAPDLSPYTYIPAKLPLSLNPKNAPLAAESQAIDWSQPDVAKLGRILWRAVRNQEPPFSRPRPADDDDDDDDD